MDVSPDLGPEQVAAALGERPARAYPALLSTDADALAWGRAGGPSGAVVVADYQASARGRGGLPWEVTAGRGLGFTLLVRPDLPPEREGWPYVAASLALRDVVADAGAQVEWPDTVLSADGEHPLARLGVYVELGPARTEWAIVTVLMEDVAPPRAPLLARAVSSLEERLSQPAERVLAEYTAQCATLGRQVRARLIPMGPGGPELTGEAVDVLADGALVVLTARGSRVAIRPQNLGLLEPPADPAEPPEQVLGRPQR